MLGSVINGIYRDNVDEQLATVASDETVEIAREGIGVVAASVPELPAETGPVVFATASEAFVDAMNTGFWLSAAVMGSAAVVAARLLPDRARSAQVERSDAPDVGASAEAATVDAFRPVDPASATGEPSLIPASVEG